MTDRMFYEQDILESLTKKTFYDSPRIVLTDLEQSLLEKTNTSLVLSIVYTRIDTAIRCVTRPLVGPHGPGSSLSFLYLGQGLNVTFVGSLKIFEDSGAGAGVPAPAPESSKGPKNAKCCVFMQFLRNVALLSVTDVATSVELPHLSQYP